MGVHTDKIEANLYTDQTETSRTRLNKIITPQKLADCYAVNNLVHTYPEPGRGGGLLLTTGAGMLLSLMDQMPGCYVAVDCGGGRQSDSLSRWIEASTHLFSHVAVIAWFSTSNPTAWENLYLKPVHEDTPIGYWSNDPFTVGTRMRTPTHVRDWSTGIAKTLDGLSPAPATQT